MATGNTIRTEVLPMFKIPSTDTSWDAQILILTNRAMGIMATEPVFTLIEQSVSLSGSTRKYALAAGTVRVEDCHLDGKSYGLRRATEEEVYRYGQITITGEPRYFWEENESIFVHPMPNTTYTLYVMAKGAPPSLAALGDTLYQYGTTALAPAYVQAIPYFVTWWLAASMKGDYTDLKNECKEAWSGLLTKAWDIDKARRRRRYGGRIQKRGRSVGPRILTGTVLDEL
jgi:hypothetical protein